MAFTPRGLARRGSTSDVPRHGMNRCLSKDHPSLRRSKSVLLRDEGPNFRYLPLDTSSQTIRLTRITCDEKCRLHGHIRHFRFGQHPTYQALSYTWGVESATKTIMMDGKRFAVRPNLYSFLQLYAIRYADQWLWVDQICIDQEAITERNHQVRLMADVFSTAKQVIIWLGSHNNEAWSQHRECDENCAASDHTSVWSTKNRFQLFPRACRWAQALLFNPYWERLWIIQELLLARRVIVWFDRDVMPWSTVRRLYSPHSSRDAQELRMKFFISNIRDEAFTGESQGVALDTNFVVHASGEPTKYLENMIKDIQNTVEMRGKLMNLEHVVKSCAESRCQDPRDKVYGIQSLVQESERVSIDYGKSTREVLVDAAVVILKNPQTGTGRGMSKDRLRELRECLLGLANAMDIFEWGTKAQQQLRTRNIDRVIGIWYHITTWHGLFRDFIRESARHEATLRSGLTLLSSSTMELSVGQSRLESGDDDGFYAWLRAHEPPKYKIVKPDLNGRENSFVFDINTGRGYHYRHTRRVFAYDSESEPDPDELALDEGLRQDAYARAMSKYDPSWLPEAVDVDKPGRPLSW